MPPSKRGLCYPVENTDPIFPWTKPGSRVSWIYNWSPSPTPSSTSPSLQFVPMQWNHVSLPSLPSHPLLSDPSSPLLLFNEPDLPSQANLSPDSAASAYLTHVQPLRAAGRLRAGSPAISSAPEGLVWLRDFLARIRAAGADVDFLCLHWYGPASALGAFYDYIWATKYALDPKEEKKVWITEFACTNWDAGRPEAEEDVVRFARQAWEYLDGLEWVERYAWFGAMREMGNVGSGAALVDKDGELTELGKGYRDW